jgi:hypothetical protein
MNLQFVKRELEKLCTLLGSRMSPKFPEEVFDRVSSGYTEEDFVNACDVYLHADVARVSFPTLLKCLNEIRSKRIERYSEMKKAKERAEAHEYFHGGVRLKRCPTLDTRDCGACHLPDCPEVGHRVDVCVKRLYTGKMTLEAFDKYMYETIFVDFPKLDRYKIPPLASDRIRADRKAAKEQNFVHEA